MEAVAGEGVKMDLRARDAEAVGAAIAEDEEAEVAADAEAEKVSAPRLPNPKRLESKYVIPRQI